MIDKLANVKQWFEKDIADHEIEVKLDYGLYRHLRFRAPKKQAYWFDIITWPGCLTINGDCGCYTFQRLEDMLGFFNGGPISPDYWASKLVAGTAKEFCEQTAEDSLKRAVADWPQEAQDDILWEADYGSHDIFIMSLANYSFTTEEGKIFELTEFYELTTENFEYMYLWCCLAISWGIEKYRENHCSG